MPFSIWIHFLTLFPEYLEQCFPGVLALGTSQGRSSSRRILRLVQVPGEKETKLGCGKWAWSPSHRSQWKSIRTLQKIILNLPISGIFRLLKEPEQLWERLNWPILTDHGKDFSFPLTDAQGSDSKGSWLVFWDAEPSLHNTITVLGLTQSAREGSRETCKEVFILHIQMVIWEWEYGCWPLSLKGRAINDEFCTEVLLLTF